MKTISRYMRLWWKLSLTSFMTFYVSRWNAVIFLTGKILRFVLFIAFLLTLFRGANRLAGFNANEVLLFYFSFILLDTVTQLFFREVYRFRELIVSGSFDLILVKPFNSLFRVLAGGADPLDLITLVPYVGCLIYISGHIHVSSWYSVFLYLLLMGNAFVIGTAFHILILALAIVTTQIDHAVMIYRDLTSMGRVPVDIYREPIRGIITFIIPIGLMMTFPVKALLGLLSPQIIILSFVLGFSFFIFSLRIWKYALTRYSSASS